VTYGERKSLRVKFEGGIDATIVGIDGTWYFACSVVDISKTGARLKLDSMIDRTRLKEFFLVLSSGGQVRRRCRLVRQLGDEIGIEFIHVPVATRTG
jgi:hypothetical protein